MHSRLRGRAEIGLRVGRVINKYTVAKHLALTITDTALDGIYLIRTNVPAALMSTADAVRH